VSFLAKYLLVLSFMSVFYLSYSVGHQMAYSIAAGIASLLIGLFVLYECYSVDRDIKMDNGLYKTAFR
jgi:inner membrane protein involved in colicin E2 resistance